MYAISFDMEISKLKKHFGDPYNPAYNEIMKVMDEIGFKWVQGSLYITKEQNNNLTYVYKAIDKLKSIDWFKKSVRDIRAFKVEDWSDFTAIVKEE